MIKVKSLLINKFALLGRVLGLEDLRRQIVDSKLLAARALIWQIQAKGTLERISDAEFKVFSQFGDDGIIQYLVHQIGIAREDQTFVEFGVQDYQESNTRFLLMNDNWRGLILDGDKANIRKVREWGDFWRYELTAVAAFIDRENVNDLFVRHSFSGEIGLMSIDIDGNDYWVWERVEAVTPIIVVAEYNSTFGSRHAVTIPYDPSFQRSRAHYSNLYWGASLKALCLLAENKGYAFVGSNSAGNNAYFVRRDRLSNLKPLAVEAGYVVSRFREARDKDGNLSYLKGAERLNEIADLPVFDIERGIAVRLADLSK